MQETRDDFAKRKSEIDVYFNFLEKINTDNAFLQYKEWNRDNSFIDKQEFINPEILKILKANGFLLLYNLVESSIKKALLAIIQAIDNDDEIITLQKLTDVLKKLWISQNISNFKNANDQTLFKLIEDITANVLDDLAISFEEKYIKKELSGNVDVGKIKEIADKYGFSSVISVIGKEYALKDIKDNRNKLSHGNITFAECGRFYSIQEMIKYKNDTIDYMQDILRNIEEFIVNRGYLKR